MDHWERSNPRRSYSNPSFSSTLLDAICRSMDSTNGASPAGHSCREPRQTFQAAKRTYYPPTMRPETAVFGHRQNNDLAAGTSNSSQKATRDPYFTTSASSSPTYRCFSSYAAGSSSACNTPRLRAIRVTAPDPRSSPPPELRKPKDAPIKSKFRPTKQYGVQKKPKSPSTKSPASPAARVAAFLNALFVSPRHPKKAKITTSASSSSTKEFGGGRGYDSAPSTVCTSKSFSKAAARSCLVKTPSSRGGSEAMPAAGARRSVRFYPVSVILDEDCRPCGQKCIFEDHSMLRREPMSVETLEGRSATKSTRAVMVTEHEGKRGMEINLRDVDDDARSDSSSDLFDLENFSATDRGGGGGYVGELPLYETTQVTRNRASGAATRGLIVG